jgi:Protein of unknown function (DUF1778)
MHIEENEHGSAVASACDNAEPAMSIEWAQNVQTIELSEEALAKVLELIEAPPRPCVRLREAAKRQCQAQMANLGTPLCQYRVRQRLLRI